MATALVLLPALAACATGSPRTGGPGRYGVAANPSAVIATELAFARTAREEGQWTAFKQYATEDALWPAPAFVSVHQSLRGEADPAEPIAWEPDAVWMSCDGSYAVSTGPANHPSGKRSRFVTVWQRQANGEYRWVLDQGFDLEDGYAQPEMISARVADCPQRASGARRAKRFPSPQRGLAWTSGASPDGTLAWTTRQSADCARTLTVRTRQDGEMREVYRRESAPPPRREGEPAPTCPG
jgi:hypothetical protein